MTHEERPIDGATLEVVRTTLLAAAEEMRTTLIRTAFSPVIYEVRDFGISIYGGNLDLIAEAPGLTRFLGANDYAVRKVVGFVGRDRLAPGDVILSNYPYWNAAHTYDATLTAPVFDDPSAPPVAYLCVRAHWQDLGAKDPGYVIDSTDMHQEGLVFPGTKLVKAGIIDRELVEIIRFNSRTPDAVMGDVHAQLSALASGQRRMRAVLDRYGGRRLRNAIDALLAHGERVTARGLARLPEGVWTAVDWLDDDGISDQPIRMQVTIRHRNGRFEIDFAGSAPAARGPVNLPFGSTLATAKVAFKALTSPFEPTNGGQMRALDVIAEPGTLFHAVYPAPTFTQWTGIVALELIFKALAGAMPDRVQACSGGDVPGFMMIGRHPDTGADFAISTNEPVGWGATSHHDGRWAGSHLAQSVVRNTPVEVLEAKTAMRIEQLALRPGSFGDGRHRGGPGLRRDIVFTADGEFLTIAKKTKSSPWGLSGGGQPEPTSIILFPDTARARRVGTARVGVQAGDHVRVLTAGGAGYGNPSDRDGRARDDDDLDELLR